MTAPAASTVPAPDRPSLRTARPEVVEAYLIAQEGRLNGALRQASRGSAGPVSLSVARLTQAGEPGEVSRPAPEVHAMVARALDTVYQADVQAAGHTLGGDRLAADLTLKGALGRFKGETLTSLVFLSHHPRVSAAGADVEALIQIPALMRHAQNVAGALRGLVAVGAALRASDDPDIQARAHRADDAQAQLRSHPRWGAAVRVAEQLSPAVQPPSSPAAASRRPSVR